jgi:hypothetical protein
MVIQSGIKTFMSYQKTAMFTLNKNLYLKTNESPYLSQPHFSETQ